LIVLPFIEYFEASAPILGGITYVPGPGMDLSSGGFSLIYTFEYASLAIPKLKALE
jgi:hypothetical protein